jgi:hypothetical protein
MKSYSQSAQDVFVYNILRKNNGTFLDLGCSHPIFINNTYALELQGWTGISVDILDFSSEWKSSRKNKFIQKDCMNVNYNDFLKQYYESTVIDYLTLDMENLGDRFKLLEKIINSNYEFKVITIEHDSYMERDLDVNKFEEFEKKPQRKLLQEKGYILLCSDVSQRKYPDLYYEDWWINSKYFNKDDYSSWFSDKMSCDKIMDKLNIKYEQEYTQY